MNIPQPTNFGIYIHQILGIIIKGTAYRVVVSNKVGTHEHIGIACPPLILPRFVCDHAESIHNLSLNTVIKDRGIRDMQQQYAAYEHAPVYILEQFVRQMETQHGLF